MIKGIASTKMDKIEVKIKEFIAVRRRSLDAEKKKRGDTSVQISNI